MNQTWVAMFFAVTYTIHANRRWIKQRFTKKDENIFLEKAQLVFLLLYQYCTLGLDFLSRVRYIV